MIAALLFAATVAPDPVPAIVKDVRAANVERTIKTLVSFGTRNTLSAQDDPKRGIGAARSWIYSEFQKIAATSDGRMTVELQSFEQQPGRFPRIAKPTKLTNVVATLQGTEREAASRVYVVSGHYDSMCTSPTNDTCDAPGADDDASGVAAVLEAARVMAPHRFSATVVFMAVAGEEQGLVGSTYFAENAKKSGMAVDAMFTNDIVGNTSGGNGVRDRNTLRVFSEGVPTTETADEAKTRQSVGGENDGPSRQLARFISATAAKYLPQFHVKMVYRRDRYLRGGDHMPFLEQGFTAVRFTEPNENYDHQHQNVRVENGKQYGDLPQFVDYAYVANVARVNAAALATLALAPARPRDAKVLTARLTNDTDLQWEANSEPSFDHYEVVWRDTTEAIWTHTKVIGRETSYTAKDLSKDNYIFGVRAVSKDGHRSPVSFPKPLRPPRGETTTPAPAATPTAAPPGAIFVNGPKTIANQPLADELTAMGAADQEVRQRWIKDQNNAAIREEVKNIDEKHVARLREIIKENGWPTFSMVGAKAANNAWLIAQHGGKEFLHETLPLMKAALDNNEMLGQNYALSVDRTRIQDGLKQIYGSQFDTKDGKCEPQPIEDPEHVDERRKAAGLEPLADYTRVLCKMYLKQ